MNSVAAILGSAFPNQFPENLSIEKIEIPTPWGKQPLYQIDHPTRPAYMLFRHGIPHRLLPHQIPYQAQAWALREVNCGALLVTSSVGVLDAQLPLFQPLLVSDAILWDNRLPNGSPCTMFEQPQQGQGHLVLQEGLFSQRLTQQVYELASDAIADPKTDVVFAYVGGPRGKTAAENRIWHQLGAQVNSMTLAPEVILANELEIPCAGLVVGHKYSLPDGKVPGDSKAVATSLEESRQSMEKIILRFLQQAEPVSFGNQIFRFDSE